MDAFVAADKSNLSEDWLDKIVYRFHHPLGTGKVKRQRGKKRVSMYELAEEYLDKKRFSYDHTKAFRVLVRDLARYEAFKKKVLQEKFAWNIDKMTRKDIEDFEDYLKSRHKQIYTASHSQYEAMLKYCRYHNKLQDYAPYFDQWTDEQMCNYALTLCHMTDKMMMSFLKKLEQEFITQGGIKERMHRARTGFRNKQDERLKQLETSLPAIKQALQQAQSEAEAWQKAYNDLKQRALAAYYRQADEIAALKAEIAKLKGKA